MSLKKVSARALALVCALSLCICPTFALADEEVATTEAVTAEVATTEAAQSETAQDASATETAAQEASTQEATTSEATTLDAATTEASAQEPTSSTALLATPELSEAKAAMVVDSQGNIIISENAEEEFNMASITKVMSAVIVLDSGISFDTEVTCTGSTLAENAQLAGYTAGDVTTVSDLFNVMLVFSANDAVYELAVAVAGSEEAFVELMNQKAADLGMTHTHYENCHGLDVEGDGHHSCVSDLVKLARYAMVNYPKIAETVCLESTTATIKGDEITFNSTDEFMKTYDGGIGIKTGFGNDTACFLGAARRNNETLYSCVLGCTTSDGRFADTATLMDAAFNGLGLTSFAQKSSTLWTRPYAYCFGWECSVVPNANVEGYVYPGQAALKTTRYGLDETAFLTPNTTVSATQWTQSVSAPNADNLTSTSRIVGTSVATTSTLKIAHTGLGLVGQISGLDVN